MSEPAVIHHNNEAIEDIAADIVLREALGELPRMEYAGSPALIRRSRWAPGSALADRSNAGGRALHIHHADLHSRFSETE